MLRFGIPTAGRYPRFAYQRSCKLAVSRIIATSSAEALLTVPVGPGVADADREIESRTHGDALFWNHKDGNERA